MSARPSPGRRWQAVDLLRVPSVLITLILACWPGELLAAPGFADTCSEAMPKEQVDELVIRMRELGASGACPLERVDTSMFRTRIRWEAGDETLELLLSPRGCLHEPTHEGERLASYAPPEFEQRCPEASAGIRAFVGEPREELVPVVRGHAPELPSPTAETRFEPAAPLVVASVAWIAALLLAGLAAFGAWQEIRNDPQRRREAAYEGLGLVAVLGLALFARAGVSASLGNWYGPFLPNEGLGELRFGASSAVLQTVIRALCPWTAEFAFATVRVTGACAAIVVMVVVRRLGGSRGAALLAGILLALAPIPVRLSASSSEHVLAGTLALAAWACWLRSASERSVIPRLLTIVLVLLAVLTRVDCWPQLALIPLWTVLAPGSGAAQNSGPRSSVDTLPLAHRLGDAVFFAASWATLGVYAWYQIVLPSNHPGPELEGVRDTARVLFSQLWVAASEPPHWISPLCLALVLLGLGVAALERRWGWLAAALLSWALIFLPLGRNLTHDGLTGARYFVLALPLLALVAAPVGERFEAAFGRLDPRFRWPARAAGIVVLTLLGTLAARPGWRHEYTFQAEYLYLAEQLSELSNSHALEDCTLWFVRPRQPTSEPDLDCCLAPDRSPLSLVAPGLKIVPMPSQRAPADERGCHLYYRGSLCSIDPELAPRSPKALARIQQQCERLRTRGGEDQIGSQEVTEHSLSERWHDPPHLELFGRFD